jgi:serine/threonine-protein kinase
MSPEHMRSSKDVDARTDLWALGAILHELITGKPPFLAESVTELAIKVANEPPPSARSFRPDVPEGLEAVISKCLEKDREQRYRNVRQLAIALLPFAPKRAKSSVERISGIIQSAGLSESALAVPASPRGDSGEVVPGRASSGTLPPVGRTTIAGKAGRPLAMLGAALGLLAVGSAATFLALGRKAPASHEDSPVPASPPAVVVAPPAETLKPEVKPTAVPTAQAPAEPASGAPQASKPASVSRPVSPSRGPTPVAPSPVAATGAPPPTAAPAPPPATAARGPANCDPPYYFDARGNRAFKPECL